MLNLEKAAQNPPPDFCIP